MDVPDEDLRGVLKTILKTYPEPDNIGKGTEFESARTDHPMYKLVVDKGTKTIKSEISEKYKINASVGRGHPAYIPYISILHPDETTSPQTGKYIIYIFDTNEKNLYLTLNQGSKEAQSLASDVEKTAKEILKSRASSMSDLFEDTSFNTGHIELSSPGRKANLYAAGTICYKKYHLQEFPNNNILSNDLNLLLKKYENLVQK